MKTAEKAELTTAKHEKTYREMLFAKGASLSGLKNSNDGKDRDDEANDGENTEQGKQSKHDEPGWVMDTISKVVQHHLPSIQQIRIVAPWLDGTGMGERGWLHVWERYEVWDYRNVGSSSCQALTEMTAATPSPTTFGELMHTVEIVPVHWQMPRGTSWPGICQIRLGSENSQSYHWAGYLQPKSEQNSSPNLLLKAVEPVNIFPCRQHL